MSEEQELAAAHARIAELEGSARAATKTQAIAGALAGHDLHPGAAGQLAALLDPTISIQRTGDGREVVMGPAFRPLEDHIRETLGKPEYAHFKRQAGFQPASSPGPAAQPVTMAESWQALPGENLGQTMLRRAQAIRSQGGADPRLDPSKPMGLRRLK
jgi:hypothetical protein